MTSPIIFVPGTSGSFLQTAAAFSYTFPGDTHIFTDGMLTHEPRSFQYPTDSKVWIGPETIADFLSDTFTVTDTLTLNVNRGNHALDVLRFDASAAPDLSITSPPVSAGDIIDEVDTGIFKNFPGGLRDIKDPIYTTLLAALRSKYGSTNVYTYPYDWRMALPQQVTGLGNRISQITGGKVILVAHSLGGLICRAYYLASQENAQRVEKVITMGTGFAGIPLGIKTLLAGDTWNLGFNLGSVLPNLAPSWLSVGLAEWETQSLAQNWPTSYYQAPNSDDWFSDDLANLGTFDRTYIRDFRSSAGGRLATFNENMAWLQQEGQAQAALGLKGLNVALIGQVQTFYNSLFTSLGNFLQGTPVPHYRIMSRGIDTVAGMKISYAPSYLASFSSNSPAPNPVNAREYQLFVTHEPIHCDGDNTVPYHGALGQTDPHDDSVYVANNIGHVALPEDPHVQQLLECLIDGDFTNCPNIRATFPLPVNAPEIRY